MGVRVLYLNHADVEKMREHGETQHALYKCCLAGFYSSKGVV